MGIFDSLKKNKNRQDDNGLNETYYNNGKGKIKERWFTKNLKKDGHYTEWNDNGLLSTEGEYKDDNKHGLWKHYYCGTGYKNGQLAHDITYKDGRMHIKRYYHENGQLKSLETYKPNYLEIDESGNKSKYFNSPLEYAVVSDGLFQTYYDNGQLMSEGNYKDGTQDGLWKYYDETGELRTTEISGWEEKKKIIAVERVLFGILRFYSNTPSLELSVFECMNTIRKEMIEEIGYTQEDIENTAENIEDFLHFRNKANQLVSKEDQLNKFFESFNKKDYEYLSERIYKIAKSSSILNTLMIQSIRFWVLKYSSSEEAEIIINNLLKQFELNRDWEYAVLFSLSMLNNGNKLNDKQMEVWNNIKFFEDEKIEMLKLDKDWEKKFLIRLESMQYQGHITQGNSEHGHSTSHDDSVPVYLKSLYAILRGLPIFEKIRLIEWAIEISCLNDTREEGIPLEVYSLFTEILLRNPPSVAEREFEALHSHFDSDEWRTGFRKAINKNDYKINIEKALEDGIMLGDIITDDLFGWEEMPERNGMKGKFFELENLGLSLVKTYYQNGNPLNERTFTIKAGEEFNIKTDRYPGYSKSWDETGQLREEQIAYIDGSTSVREWHENGQLGLEVISSTEGEIKLRGWDEDGNPDYNIR